MKEESLLGAKRREYPTAKLLGGPVEHAVRQLSHCFPGKLTKNLYGSAVKS
jgi:hypothetical protein